MASNDNAAKAPRVSSLETTRNKLRDHLNSLDRLCLQLGNRAHGAKLIFQGPSPEAAAPPEPAPSPEPSISQLHDDIERRLSMANELADRISDFLP